MFLSLAMIFSLLVTPAFAAPTHADTARDKANSLAKQGRTLEAASELRVAAETAGPEGPALRFEAALMLQRSGELRDALSLHDEVSRDSNTDFELRVKARYAEELLFWSIELSSLAAPSHDRLMTLRDVLKESERRHEGTPAEDAALIKRLSEMTTKIKESRRSLSALVGPNDPMIQELDGLLQACAEQQRAVPSLKKSSAEAQRLLATAKRAIRGLNAGIEKLSAFAKAQVELLKKGQGDLRSLKKHHDGLLKKGSRVAQGAVGKLASVDAAIARAREKLSERERIVLEIQGVVSAAEIVLGTGP